jgi:2-oxoglutarate dehydrogenase E1 component
MLKELIRHAGKSGTREVVLGMAHRGRLNVLVNVLGKKPQDLFDEFAGKHKEHLGTGDVKYHMGFSSDIETEGGLVHLALAFNPSHLEIVSPVVIGSVRARLDRLDEPSSNKVLPITIHGDAAVTGQGVVQETLNMSKARGYEVGGTVRIVINNQVGFTTSNPLDARSTRTAPTSVRWCRRRSSTLTRMTRKPLLSLPVWRWTSVIPSNAMCSSTCSATAVTATTKPMSQVQPSR